MFVYIIKCLVTNKRYVGVSTDPQRRYWEHCYRAGVVDSKLGRAINKYGKAAFYLEHIYSCTRKEAFSLECQFIKHLNTYYDGYNNSFGGEGSDRMIPWNKGTKGLTKPNKTSFVLGSSGNQKLTKEQQEELVQRYNSGETVKKFASEYNIHWVQAYRVIRKMGKN